VSEMLAEVRHLIDAEDAVVIATVVQSASGAGARMLIYPDGTSRGSLGGIVPDARAVEDGLAQLGRAASKTLSYESTAGEARGGTDAEGETLVFYDVYPAPERILIFGGVHIAVPLVELASTLGFRTSVIDARGQFANRERFPRATDVIVSYADEFFDGRRLNQSTSVVVLTHDPKLDDPALIHALKAPAIGYIGAIGSRKTHAKRVERLKDAGLTDAQIEKIHAPIGLDVGARNPEEIALSIVSEIVAVRNGSKLATRVRPIAQVVSA